MTIPGYTPDPSETRPHIHLGLVPYGGGSPSGFGSENEPPYTFVHIQKRIPHYETSLSFERSWLGAPIAQSLRRPDGVLAVRFKDLQYEIRVTPEEENILQYMLGSSVYLVDSRHCPDNSDHAPYTRIMRFTDMTYDENLDPVLNYNVVTLTFKDESTVAAP